MNIIASKTFEEGLKKTVEKAIKMAIEIGIPEDRARLYTKDIEGAAIKGFIKGYIQNIEQLRKENPNVFVIKKYENDMIVEGIAKRTNLSRDVIKAMSST